MKTPVVHMHSDMGPYSKVVSLCLRRLGVVRSIGLSDLLRRGESVQTWVSVSDHTLLDTQVLSQEQGGAGDVLAVPVVATYEQGKGRWWGGGRVRVDFDQPVSVKEMVTGKTNEEKGQFLAQHMEFNRRNLGRVTASQLVGFVLMTGYCQGRGVAEVTRGVEEIRGFLTDRGVDVAFNGEGAEVVEWGVSMLGGRVSKGEVKLNSNGEEEMWKQGRYVEQFFVPEAVIGAVVMSLVGQQLDCFKEGTKEGSITVSQEKLMKRGELLLRLLGEDKRQVPPCAEIAGVLVEGITRAERWEGLGKVQGPRESQHGQGKWSRRVARQVDIENDWQEDVDRYVDTELVVGVSIAGRKWLKWVAGILRPRVRNMMYTTQVLHKVLDQGVVRMEDVVMWVKEEVEKRNKVWNVAIICGDRELTERAIEVLVSAGVVTVVIEAGVKWVSVTEMFDSREMVEEVVRTVMEYKC